MRSLQGILFASAVILFADVSASESNCTITNFSEVATVVDSCTDIVISNLIVPAGVTLELYLRNGTSLTFNGTIKFEHTFWSGPLVRIKGSNITVEGKESVLDGQGPLYWDGKGDTGPKKPQFMKIEADGGSVLKDIFILNCPHHCIYIGKSDHLTISRWLIDVSDGDKHNFTGRNTDGFDVSGANNLIIENSRVVNQDDCVAIRYGSNITLRNLYCSGGHGLSLSVGFNKTSFPENVASNILVENCTVVKSANAIHLKTHTDAYYGEIRNVTYRNIEFIGGINYGINIQQDYMNGSGTGITKDNIPIKDLTFTNITGVMSGPDSMSIRVLCAENACPNWNWFNIKITNASLPSSCNYTPANFTC
ncbi:hypothetical protein JTB14_005508 [Gonioctena quinquepunctata]|nr:hypothetical protein JTB14_005508 [Gonioctena quinquepunctata]